MTDRRDFLAACSTLGVGGSLFPGVLWAKVAAGAEITDETIVAAAEVAGVTFSPEDRALMLDAVKGQTRSLDQLHAIPLENAVAPAMIFTPLPRAGAVPTGPQHPVRMSRRPATARPARLEDLAFAELTTLADLVRRRVVTSVDLTTMYLARLERLDPKLLCTTTVLRERALAQARAADAEIAAGRWRGPLHGIPWGAKDLLAVRGAPTTWGSAPFRDQRFDEDATVVQRLDAAGAVLIAKLTLGELAQGDRWYGGMTRNPWKLDQGSSGSSAGPGSATAAGCVGFAIGSETLGSISSPSTRNGVTGLRPTFGRVPRTGAMALSWSMDKLGPMCRSVEDCALVFSALHGPDGRDQTVHAAPFNWDGDAPLRGLKVGYVKSAFDAPLERHPTKPFDDAALGVLRGLGLELIPVELPDFNYNAMRIILTAEAGAAFDAFTRSGRVREMAQQGAGAWPNQFRTSRFIPAVDYVNANRVRTLAIEAWDVLMRQLDVIVTPTAGTQLTATNLTGHPAVILPNGFRDDGTPVSLTFLGRLFGEESLLRVAHHYQRATPHHHAHPELG
ncbi:MAG: amidase [Gemmatimonadaceae bacterium]|nr:amidase [Gemmatimonadaceae bacterium]